MPRYKLRTLLIVLALGPPIVAAVGWLLFGVVLNWTDGILWHDD